ncbi:MAG: lipid A deacylase LpxR family protein [Sulfurimonas sp.]
MKIYILIITLLMSVVIFADELSLKQDDTWRLERTNIYFDNDVFLSTDNQYTAGVKLSNVYFIPHTDNDFLKVPFVYDEQKAHFVSLGIAQQMYTPVDLTRSDLIEDDRPYAGWLYLEYGLHQSSADELDSFLVQIGIVGKYSGAEFSQKTIHGVIGSEKAEGWDNQLNNELGINLIYQHKWRFVPDTFLGMDSNLIPFVGASLGNVKTKASAGVLARFGWYPSKDFGSSSIDIGGENGIPIRTNCLCSQYEPWSFTFNFSASGDGVARDIFLDGNTFTDSHSVEKENFIGHASYGFTARYNHVSLDYIVTYSTEHFTKETSGHKFGTILLSYLY